MPRTHTHRLIISLINENLFLGRAAGRGGWILLLSLSKESLDYVHTTEGILFV